MLLLVLFVALASAETGPIPRDICDRVRGSWAPYLHRRHDGLLEALLLHEAENVARDLSVHLDMSFKDDHSHLDCNEGRDFLKKLSVQQFLVHYRDVTVADNGPLTEMRQELPSLSVLAAGHFDGALALLTDLASQHAQLLSDYNAVVGTPPNCDNLQRFLKVALGITHDAVPDWEFLVDTIDLFSATCDAEREEEI